jgi:ADP-ribose pyrophosphatase YjhB (NUDIX family)
MNYFDKYQPGLSVDCVIFGFHENELKVLLLKMKNLSKWAVPGGFVLKDEGVDEAADHVLMDRANISSSIDLHQFRIFGKPNRSNDAYVDKLVADQVISEELDPWFRQRFVTVGYYALVEFSRVTPSPDSRSEKCEWIPYNQIPELILDHKEIIDAALSALRNQLRFQPVGKTLLPEKFTMTELRTLYETILDKKLDRRNFQRKMLSYGVLDKLDETRKGGAHKAPYLYSFNDEKYDQTVATGFSTIW